MKSGHGGPFGAVIVSGKDVVSVAHNTVLSDSNPTRHAEMNAIRIACSKLGSADLSGCVLYTTCGRFLAVKKLINFIVIR